MEKRRKPPTIILDNILGDAQILLNGDSKWTEAYRRYVVAANFFFNQHSVNGLSLKLGSHANFGIPGALPEPCCEFRLRGRELAYLHYPTKGTDGMHSAFDIASLLHEKATALHLMPR